MTCRILLFLTLASVALSPVEPTAAERPRATSNEAADAPQQPAPKSRSRGRSASARAAARRAEREAAQRERQAKEREQWLARLKARDVEPWPDPETDAEHAAALTKSRMMSDEVIELLPGMQLMETEFFLITSNMPPDQIAPYAAYLDRMYEWMCQLYGLPKGKKVWLGGKVPIFAFLEREQFEAFEERFFPEARRSLGSLVNIYGLCHQSPSGEVIIACYRGDDPNAFGQMLVHETSHGFNHRYKTKAALPNWVDEGMADLIGAELVPASVTVKNREQKAYELLMQQRSLGGMLTTERIQAWQYGVASSLNRFLLQANRDNYVRFIECLKEGLKYDEALREAYGSTPEEMLAHYSRWLGIPDLRP